MTARETAEALNASLREGYTVIMRGGARKVLADPATDCFLAIGGWLYLRRGEELDCVQFCRRVFV